MIKKLTLLLLIVIASVVVHSQSQSQRRELTPQEKKGKAFYLRGESASGQEIIAMMGEVDVPATTLTCAGCHGNRGEGRTEGGVTAGNLTWNNLLKPYGHTHPNGRKHGPFTESSSSPFTSFKTSSTEPSGARNFWVREPKAGALSSSPEPSNSGQTK